MAARNKNRSEREARERARLYRARTDMHEAGTRRRLRDNWIAGVVGGLIIVGAIGSQVIYYTAGPGVPVPEPTPVVTPSETPAPSVSPDPSEAPAEAPPESPAESPAP